ncbi:hypothetical protein ScPMuIL_007693 [Solemya velum]
MSSENDMVEVSVLGPSKSLLTIIQLSDSAFPTGGFSHSSGLEAWYNTQKTGRNLSSNQLYQYILCCLENCGSFSLPFLNEALNSCHDNDRLKELDGLFDVCTANHVSLKASKRQGRSFLDTVSKVYPHLCSLEEVFIHCHYVVTVGTVCGLIGLDKEAVQSMFVFLLVRNILASAVRLNIVGPLEAQVLQERLNSNILDVIERYRHGKVESACVTFPCVEIIQNTHDTLFSRLFYS